MKVAVNVRRVRVDYHRRVIRRLRSVDDAERRTWHALRTNSSRSV